MKPDDAFEGILASLYEAMLDEAHWPETCALIDEACGVMGTALVVGERSGCAGHIHFARYLRRGEIQHERAREYFDVVVTPRTRACAASWGAPKAGCSTERAHAIRRTLRLALVGWRRRSPRA